MAETTNSVRRFRLQRIFHLAMICISFAQWHFCTDAHAAISAINTPVTSMAGITFNDTASFDPILTPGTTNSGPTASPWTGATLTMTLTTDPITSDSAQGSITASFIPASNTYSLSLANVTASQAVGNTGLADLLFDFNVEYQLDAAGLPSQATLFPNFLVNGTVQPAGGFAQVSGFINYDGTNTAGTISTVETVNYFTQWTTPGPFTGTAFGIPVNGTTPVLVGGTTLTLWGQIHFTVDPATINAESVQAPEPGTVVMAGLGSLGLLIAARRRRTHARSGN